MDRFKVPRCIDLDLLHGPMRASVASGVTHVMPVMGLFVDLEKISATGLEVSESWCVADFSWSQAPCDV